MIVPNELGSTTPYIYKHRYIIYIYYITYNHQGTIPLNTAHMDLKTSMVVAWLPRALAEGVRWQVAELLEITFRRAMNP